MRAVRRAVLGLRVPETRPEDDSDRAGHGGHRLLHPGALLPGVAVLAGVSGMAGFFAFVPLYAPELGLGGSRFVFLTFSAIVLVIRSVGARIPDVLGPHLTLRAALGVCTTGLVTMGLWQRPAGLFAGTAVFAVGVGLAFPGLMSLAVAGAPPSERGAVLGTFTAFVDLGFGLGAVTLGVVAAAGGYPSAFLAASAISATGLLALLTRGARPLSRTASATPPAPV